MRGSCSGTCRSTGSLAARHEARQPAVPPDRHAARRRQEDRRLLERRGRAPIAPNRAAPLALAGRGLQDRTVPLQRRPGGRADSSRGSGRGASHREQLRCAIESCAGHAGNRPGQAAAGTSRRCCTRFRRRSAASARDPSPGSPACSVSETAGRRLEGLGRRLSPAPSPTCPSSALSRSPAPQRLPAGPRRSVPSRAA